MFWLQALSPAGRPWAILSHIHELQLAWDTWKDFFSLWALVPHSGLLRWPPLPVPPLPRPIQLFSDLGVGCGWAWREGEGLHPLAAVTVAHHVPLLPVLCL